MIGENLLTMSKQRNMIRKAQNHQVMEKRPAKSGSSTKHLLEKTSIKTHLVDRSFYESAGAKAILNEHSRSSATYFDKRYISCLSVPSVNKTKPFIGFFKPLGTEV